MPLNQISTNDDNMHDSDYNLKPITSRKQRDSLLKLGSGSATQESLISSVQDKINNNTTDDDISTISYISVKDFAYDESNPLHYGYFDEDEMINDQESQQHQNVYLETIPSSLPSVNENNNNNADDTEDIDSKRQSIVLPNDYIVNQKAVALYDFQPENDNELELKEGDIVFISYRHGQGWLVAENSKRTRTGLVPEEFVSFIEPDQLSQEHDISQDEEDVLRPFYLTEFISRGLQPTNESGSNKENNISINNQQTKNDNKSDAEWEDIDDIDNELQDKLLISQEN